MTDSLTHGREHGKGRRAECKREAISLRFFWQRNCLPNDYSWANLLHLWIIHVAAFKVLFCCFFPHLRLTLEKPCTEAICKTAAGFNGWKGSALGGVTARCFSLKPPTARLWVTVQITPSFYSTPVTANVVELIGGITQGEASSSVTRAQFWCPPLKNDCRVTSHSASPSALFASRAHASHKRFELPAP